MYTVLVTTGATVTFKSLVQKFLDPKFIQELQDIQVTKLIIQYGNEQVGSKHISDQFFLEQIKQANFGKTLQLTYSNYEDRGSAIERYKSDKFEIIAFPYSPYIDEYIQQADIVISHAGTGSIIDTLRNHKKLMVIVNDKLMDNHQLEIANEFTNMKYCLSYQVKELDSNEFIKDIQGILNGNIELNLLAENDGSALESIIYDELMN